MPWQEMTPMSQREEFIRFASHPDVDISQLCHRYGISRKTGYKWLQRYRREGISGLRDRSRAPHRIPHRKQTPELLEAIVQLRLERRWGGRKIKAALERSGFSDVPAASTISAIIKRHDLPPLNRRQCQAFRRFEADGPNDLWQMDFKGPIRLRDGSVEPLTVLDDYSRFNVGLFACIDKRGVTVQHHLVDLFRRYGLPWRILADNGSPWGAWLDTGRHPTQIGVWLMTLGIRLIHSRPFHPQTCGKDERFHRTLKQELTGKEMNCWIRDCQDYFDDWRDVYNLHRPHEALGMNVPAERYRCSERVYPDRMPSPDYFPGDDVRVVHDKGRVMYRGHQYRIGEAFKGQRIAIRSTDVDHIKHMYFYRYHIKTINTKNNENVSPMYPNDV